MPTQNSYSLQNIILLESDFKRTVLIDFTDTNIKNDLHLETTSQNEGADLLVTLGIRYSSKNGTQENISAFVKMAGIFQCPDDTSHLPIEVFSKVNAPAIIFPFIREHLASLTMKAGISPVILQPLNFVNLSNQGE